MSSSRIWTWSAFCLRAWGNTIVNLDFFTFNFFWIQTIFMCNLYDRYMSSERSGSCPDPQSRNCVSDLWPYVLVPSYYYVNLVLLAWESTQISGVLGPLGWDVEFPMRANRVQLEPPGCTLRLWVCRGSKCGSWWRSREKMGCDVLSKEEAQRTVESG